MLAITATKAAQAAKQANLAHSVTVVFPFEPKMDNDEVLERAKKIMLQKAAKKLKGFGGETGVALKNRLAAALLTLSHEVYTKSVAVHIAPNQEKVLYLNYAADEFVACNHAFNINHIAANKKSQPHYAAIVLTGCHAKIYTGDNVVLRRTATLSADYVPAGDTQTDNNPCHIANKLTRRDEMVKAFIQYTDNTIEYLVEPRPYPVFVFGPAPYVQYFKQVTRHNHLVAGYFSGGYQDATENTIINTLQPYFSDWVATKQQILLQYFEKAFGQGQAVAGIKHVYHKTLERKPWLLLVEKSFTAHTLNTPKSLATPYNDIDLVIENVLRHNGEVEFVEDGALNCYGHIALVQADRFL
jgi:hypothetical protein